MKDMERLEQALKTLREADAGRGASNLTEIRLRAAFREHHARRRRKWWWPAWTWASAAAVAASVVFAVSRLVSPVEVQAPPAVVVKAPEPAAVPPAGSAPAAAAPAVAKRAAKKPARAEVRPDPLDASVAAGTRRDLDGFIAIPYAPPLTVHDPRQVVRVRVPRQSLRSLGIPVNEERMFERVPADLLMGVDGVPRAIRFVNDRR
jgi:hypothetical protein